MNIILLNKQQKSKHCLSVASLLDLVEFSKIYECKSALICFSAGLFCKNRNSLCKNAYSYLK